MNFLFLRIGARAMAGVVAMTGTVLAAAELADDPAGQALMQAAQRAITAYHSGQPGSAGVLRVVYFHPNDREPLPGYADRLDRLMTDVSDFYRDGLRRFGFENDGLPLERRDGRLVLHVVRGQSPASAYTHEDGDRPKAEIRAALKGVVDLDREHVLVLYGLCRKESDGRYVFDAPYYGGGSQRAGLAHAADCELLDPMLLTETKKKIVYTEHYYPRVEQTYARFNSWYIGGIAHELGHGLGLEHDAGSMEEKRFGTSLMGGGNHTYRQEVWNGGAPTYLSRASAVKLAAHPLFTQSNRGRWDAIGAGFEALTFSVVERQLRIEGKVAGAIAPYAVVAHVWPTSAQTNHGAISFPVSVHEGAFAVDLAGLKPNTYHLRLVSLHLNGGTAARTHRLEFDPTGNPDAAALNRATRAERNAKP